MIEDGSVPGILLWPLPAHAKRDNVVWALAHLKVLIIQRAPGSSPRKGPQLSGSC